MCAFLIASCAPEKRAASAFDAWLAAEPGRAQTFARFEATLRKAGVGDVVDNHQLWRADRTRPQCVTEPFARPPEDLWRNIVPALRFVRDQVKPAIGDVEVVSAYRSLEFNTCIRGAKASAHRRFFALDLTPADSAVTRAALIEKLCPLHGKAGPRSRIGLGIYGGRRFHIDARSFRGWGADRRGASFPCAAAHSR